MTRIPITFYTRQACPLCEEALRVVEEVVRRSSLDADLQVIDVDTSLELLARFDEDVPVIEIDGSVAFLHRVGAAAFQTALARAAALMSLREERCVPEKHRYLRLDDEESRALLALLGNGWVIRSGRLEKEVRLPDFAAALAIANQIGAIAEECGHHPDLALGWGYVRISLTTHDAGGLSRSDFVLAARLRAAIEAIGSET